MQLFLAVAHRERLRVVRARMKGVHGRPRAELGSFAVFHALVAADLGRPYLEAASGPVSKGARHAKTWDGSRCGPTRGLVPGEPRLSARGVHAAGCADLPVLGRRADLHRRDRAE